MQSAIRDEHSRPHRFENLFFRNNLRPSAGQVDENVHRLASDLARRPVTADLIHARLNEPRSDAKIGVAKSVNHSRLSHDLRSRLMLADALSAKSQRVS